VNASLARLHRERPRSRLVRLSLALLAALVVWAWCSGEFDFRPLGDPARREHLAQFVTVEVVPYPLRGAEFSWPALGAWAGALWREHGAEALVATLSIAVLAISLAGLGALLLAPFAARTLATVHPFEQACLAQQGHAGRRRAWQALNALVRAGLIFLRAIPEYVWAFLLLAMLGPSAWPAVLALAIHNAGILGKLGAETIENLERKPLAALTGLGARRAQLWFAAVLPLSLSRFLLYFFYRFETCVREATVLGMLGVVSLGYWIQDARAKLFYDEMLFFVTLGAAIVLLGDLVSTVARALLRRA